MRTYDWHVVRKCVSFAFGLTLVMALGFAMTHVHLQKASSASIGFSTPCEPAVPGFNAPSESRVVSTSDSTFAAENTGAPLRVVRVSQIEAVAPPTLAPAPAIYPPLLHRPPPANS